MYEYGTDATCRWATSKDLLPCSRHHRRRTADAWLPGKIPESRERRANWD
jgi:hypothetical protein